MKLQILYLDCSCPNVSLGIFPETFGIFRAFKTISTFSEIVFALKINLKKQILSFWIGPSPKARPYPVRLGPAAGPLKPIWARRHRCQAQQAPPSALGLGVRATPGAVSCPYKGAEPEAARALDAAAARV
jgi:hypothetical protein